LSYVNPDGSANTPLAIKLPEVGFAAWSRDGRQLAVTSPDPEKTFTLSRDIFIVDLATTQIKQLTAFPNTWGSISTNRQNNEIQLDAAKYTLPWYKAFSPDGRKLAVSVQEVNASRVTTTGGGQLELTTGSTTTPMLKIYDLDTKLPLVLAAAGAGADIHAGDGVDWAPNADLLVWPKDINIVYGGLYGGQVGPATALFVMEPVADALSRGHGKQITFPQGEADLLP
jgi:hypothetical protein